MNIFRRHKRLLFHLLCSGIMILSLSKPLPVISPLATVLFFLSLGTQITAILFNHKKRSIFWGTLLGVLAVMFISTIFYYLHGTTSLTIIITLCLSFLPFLKKITTPLFSLKHLVYKDSLRTAIFTGISFISAVALLFMLFGAQTQDVLVSPWHALSRWFFIVYAFGIGTSLITMHASKHSWIRYTLASIYLGVAYSVASIIYTQGFGFDGFIHRATESWIAENGFINPKQPFYIGQYSLIVLLHKVTGLSIFILDTFFVPLLSAITLPFVIGKSLKESMNIPKNIAVMFSYLLPFLYIITLNLTTPHNLVLLLFILCVYSLYLSIKTYILWIIPIAIAIGAVITHPLLGGPICLFTAIAYLYHKTHLSLYKKHIGMGILFLMMIFLPSAMFIANNYLGGFGLPELSNPFNQLHHFLSLFDRPYYYQDNAGIILTTVYAWERVLPYSIIILALFGWIKSTTTKRKTSRLFILGFASFIFAAWFLRTWLVFPNVAAAEQNNYPLRLLWSSLLFILPLASYGIYELYLWLLSQAQKIHLPKRLTKLLIVVITSMVLMLSLYFSYPQRNEKVRFPGFNVTVADKHAVTWIHNQHNEIDYVVLANPLTSVAALTEFSFAKHYQTSKGELFYYAIPSGGPLYKEYTNMIYEGQKREYMEEAMNLTDTNTSYFIINSYWKNFDSIVEGAKNTADSFHEIDGGDIMIFRYDR